MIKFLKNEDIIITPFTIAKDQILNSILGDLILGTDGEISFPLGYGLSYVNNNKSGSCDIINNEVYLAINQFDNEVNFRIGKYFSKNKVFFPSGSKYYTEYENPLNLDGTYQGQVYNTVKKMYYNDYNNAYNIFGFDEYDTSKADLYLQNDFSEFTILTSNVGDRIRPKTLKINNQSGDIISDIFDDGNNNLILSGTFFINKYNLSSSAKDLTTPNELCGLGGYLFNPNNTDKPKECCDPNILPIPTPLPTPTPSVNATPSLTPSRTPAATPLVTPSFTPSSTPDPSIGVSPSITPSATSLPSYIVWSSNRTRSDSVKNEKINVNSGTVIVTRNQYAQDTEADYANYTFGYKMLKDYCTISNEIQDATPDNPIAAVRWSWPKTFTFSKPVKDPHLAIWSLGATRKDPVFNISTGDITSFVDNDVQVRLRFYTPGNNNIGFVPVCLPQQQVVFSSVSYTNSRNGRSWTWPVTYSTPMQIVAVNGVNTDLIGKEGYAIIKFPGIHTSITVTRIEGPEEFYTSYMWGLPYNQ